MRGKLVAPILALVIAPTTAFAGGLYVPGQGPIAQSRAGADVAAVDDPSALATNPAGLAETHSTQILIGSNFLDYSLQFTRRGAYEDTSENYPWEGKPYPLQTNDGTPAIGVGPFQALPEISAVFDLDPYVKGLRVAAGVFVPNSFPTRNFGGDWQLNKDDLNGTKAPPPSRYDVVKQDAAIIMPSIDVAYRISKLISVGGRFSPGIATIKATSFTWGDANYQEDTQHDSVFNVDAKDSFVPAFALGVQVHPTDAIDVGLDWDSEADVHAKGTGTALAGRGLDIGGMPATIEPPPDDQTRCAPGGKIGALKACINIALPMTATLGGRYKLLDEAGAVKGDVEVDLSWENWGATQKVNNQTVAVQDYTVIVDGSVLGALPLNPSVIKHNFQDVYSVRVGGSYLLPVGDGLSLRGGLAYDTAAAKPGWERLDIDGAPRTTIGLGVGYPFGKVDVSVGGGFVYEGSRDVGGNCNPTATMAGCSGNNMDDPPSKRPGPDPIQPLNAGTPFESPINAGHYKSSYVSLSAAAVYRF